MDKSQALNTFWNQFGIPAYDEYTVPDGLSMPYITYETATDSVGSIIPLTASIWYRSPSWEEISKKAETIAKTIAEYGYWSTKIYGGYMLIRKNEVFAQRMDDPEDDGIRRIILSITVEFLVAY